MKEGEGSNGQNKQEEIEIQEELDMESFNVVLRLYDKTFKDLAKR